MILLFLVVLAGLVISARAQAVFPRNTGVQYMHIKARSKKRPPRR